LPFFVAAVANCAGGLVSNVLVKRIGLKWGRCAIGVVGLGIARVGLAQGRPHSAPHQCADGGRSGRRSRHSWMKVRSGRPPSGAENRPLKFRSRPKVACYPDVPLRALVVGKYGYVDDYDPVRTIDVIIEELGQERRGARNVR